MAIEQGSPLERFALFTFAVPQTGKLSFPASKAQL